MAELDVDRILARARDATRDLLPAPGLAERLAARAMARRGLIFELARLTRPALVAAALAAAASFAVLVGVEGSVRRAASFEDAPVDLVEVAP